jgi:hypothetical protein
MTDLKQVNEALKHLEKSAVQTKNGAYVRLDDVKKLMEGRVENAKEEAEKVKERGKIKTVEQARAAAKRDPDIKEFFENKGSKEPGKAIAARPPTAVEGVKA